MRVKFIVLFLFFNLTLNAQWGELNSGTTISLNSGSTANIPPAYIPRDSWVCGNNGLVLKSTNYGNSWNQKDTGIPSNVTLVNICAFDTSLVLTSGYIDPYTYVYRTSNGGNNWVQVFTQVTGVINGIWMRSALSGFMAGNPVNSRWSLWKTTNGGVNWDSTGMYLPQAGFETGWNNSMWCNGNLLWFGTNSFRIYHSSNFGQTWLVQSTSPVGSIYSIFFDAGSNRGYAGGTGLLSTTNLGYNWTVVPNTPGTGNIVGILGSNPGVLSSNPPYFYIRSSGTIYTSGFSGNNWILSYTAPAGSYTYAFKPRANDNNSNDFGSLFAVRNNGGITGCACYFGKVTQISNTIPESFSLSQNYPNPFNPVTNIKFDLPKAGFVKLMIYDALGREITQLVNQQLQAGSYNADWDATNYPSGVYFYSLLAGDFSETKKMVLLR